MRGISCIMVVVSEGIIGRSVLYELRMQQAEIVAKYFLSGFLL